MKYSEIIKMNANEINSMLSSTKEQLLDLRLMHSVSLIENPMLIKSNRKVIAKMKTALSQLKNKLVSDVN